MLPFTEAVVPEVDVEAGRIVVVMPRKSSACREARSRTDVIA